MTQLEALSLALSVTCEACGRPVPVHGLVEQTSCPSCNRAIALPTEWWLGFLDGGTIALAMEAKQGESRQVTLPGNPSARATLGRDPPRCPRCNNPLPIDTHAMVQATGQGWLGCGCGGRLPVRPAPPLGRVLLIGSRYVVGEGAGTSRFHLLAELSEEDWMRILAEDPELVGGLATSEELPPDLLLRFVRSDDRQVRRAVSRNPRLDPEQQAALARDPEREVRRALAGRESLAPEVLRRLVADADDEVRAALAARPDLSPDLQQRLASDSSWRVRLALVQSPHVDDAVLVEIARREDDPEALDAFASGLPLPEAMLEALAANGHEQAPRVAAAHPRCPPPILSSLAESRDIEVRRLVAGHPSTPAPTLEQLARDEDRGVRAALLARKSLPEAVTRLLMADADGEIRSRMLARPEAATIGKARQRRLVLAALGLIGIALCGGLITALVGLAMVAGRLL